MDVAPPDDGAAGEAGGGEGSSDLQEVLAHGDCDGLGAV